MTAKLKVCVTCKKSKGAEQYETSHGHLRNECRRCRNEKKKARAIKKAAVTLPKARHPWELLGADCRPDWSKL